MHADQRAWHRVRALLDGEITYVDYRIGKLIGWLEQRGLLDDTVIIVTADHGDFLGEHGFGGHTYGMGEFLIHVPLVVRYPRRVEAGALVDRIVELRDLPGTIGALIGSEPPNASIHSPRNLLVPSPKDRPFAYARRHQTDGRGRAILARKPWGARFLQYDEEVEVLRTDRWQFRRYGDGRTALYDMDRDVGEMHDVAAGWPIVVRELQSSLQQFVAEAQQSRRHSSIGQVP